MRLFVMTGRSHGLGALALPGLVASDDVEVVALVHVRGGPAPLGRRLRRAVRKALRIGPLGALNGVRMRRWYGEALREALGLRPVDEVAASLGVPVVRVGSLRDEATREAVRALEADVGLSLGNGYIPEAVFSLPRLGMLNVHHELLPEFRGAQGVIWQLHEGSDTTGFTVHAIDRSIDTGKVIHRETVRIDVRESLEETVTRTMAELYRRSAARLPELLVGLERRLEDAPEQGPGRSFTTPSWSAFRRIRREHRRLLERRRRAEG